MLWPGAYVAGMASLGYLWVWEQMNIPGICAGLRYFNEPPCFDGVHPALSLEDRYPLAACDVIAVSISYELDVIELIRMLEKSDVPALASERSDEDPLVVVGGPLTRANPFVLQAVADVVVRGDGEAGVSAIRKLLERGEVSREGFLAGLAGVEGVMFSGGTAVKAALSPRTVLPVVSRVVAPSCSLGNLSLVEVSRGCPQACAFCLGHRMNGPTRMAPLDRVTAAIPEHAVGVGLVGAAVSHHPHLPEMLEWAVQRGLSGGISSLRADRSTPEILGLLKRLGTTVLTIAADGASQRLRDSIGKGLGEDDLVKATLNGREAGLHAVKLYAMFGFEDETDEDLEELGRLVNRLQGILPVILSLSPLVPKRSTPLENSAFTPVRELSRRLMVLKKGLSRGVQLRSVSPRESLLQYLVTRCEAADGGRLLQLSRTDRRFSDWRNSFGQALTTLE